VILRPTTIGKSMHAYVDYKEERLLRVGTYAGGKGTGTGILGLFNVSERNLSEFVALREFPGVEEETEYVVRAHTTGEVSGAMKLGDAMALASLELDVKGWEILSSYPLRSFSLKGRKEPTKVAVLGLLGKMTGAAAVRSSDGYVEESGRLRIWTSLKALGVLGLYISDLGERTIEDDFMIIILGKVIPVQTVTIQGANSVLEIDVERAWKEMKLDSGWSNEVSLEIFIK